jgi:hypothetical protein
MYGTTDGRYPIPGLSALGTLAHWLEAESGDAILFDPRILHSGSPITGPKFSMFLAYGQPNGHFHRHSHYYRHVRGAMHYGALPLPLVARLRDEGLYVAEGLPAEPTAISWRPSAVESWRGRALR